MIKLNEQGKAVQVYDYDQDHEHLIDNIQSVDDIGNVELHHESQIKPVHNVKRIKKVKPKNLNDLAYARNVKGQVTLDQMFHGVDESALIEEALRQSEEFDPCSSNIVANITDFPQIIDRGYNMNFNGYKQGPQMGSWFSDVTGINLELDQDTVADTINDYVSGGTQPVTPKPPTSGVPRPPTSTIAQASMFGFTMSAQTKKLLVYTALGLGALTVASLAVPMVRKIFKKS